MTKRERLELKQEKIFDKIKQLDIQAVEIQKQLYLLCDKKQWYTEKIETSTISLRPKREEDHLIGRINWTEGFTDESTGEIIYIDRNEIVKVDGKWL